MNTQAHPDYRLAIEIRKTLRPIATRRAVAAALGCSQALIERIELNAILKLRCRLLNPTR